MSDISDMPVSDSTHTPPRATIVMIARERHALTETALEYVNRNTAQPYRLIYTDGQTPDWLWQRLAQRAPQWGLELMRQHEALWPSALRNRVLEFNHYRLCSVTR